VVYIAAKSQQVAA